LIAVIADTHMPKGSRRLPELCVELLRDAEAAIHAGDFFAVSALAEVELGGHRLGVVHDAGPAARRLQRLRAAFPECDAVVFGHSHLPLHERGDDGFQIFNPGSPTERRRAPRRSMGLLRIGAGGLEFEHVWLDAPAGTA
jgi:predicted phosphodiesterase